MRNTVSAILFVAGLGLGSIEASVQSWPAKRSRRSCPSRPAARSTSYRAWRSNNSPCMSVSPSSWRPPGAGGTDGRRFRRQVRSRWLYAACAFVRRIPSRQRSTAPGLPSVSRLRGRRSARLVAVHSWCPRARASSPLAICLQRPERNRGCSATLSRVRLASDLSAERFISSAGLKAVHVSFKGGRKRSSK